MVGGRRRKVGAKGRSCRTVWTLVSGRVGGGGHLFAVNPFQFRSSPRMVVALIGYRLKELERSSANGIYKRLDITRLFVSIRFNIYIYIYAI